MATSDRIATMSSGVWRSVEPRLFRPGQGSACQIKIGYTSRTNAHLRLRELERQYKTKLELLGVLSGGAELEIALHSRFRPYRSGRGVEWYSSEIILDVLRLLDEPRGGCIAPSERAA